MFDIRDHGGLYSGDGITDKLLSSRQHKIELLANKADYFSGKSVTITCMITDDKTSDVFFRISNGDILMYNHLTSNIEKYATDATISTLNPIMSNKISLFNNSNPYNIKRVSPDFILKTLDNSNFGLYNNDYILVATIPNPTTLSTSATISTWNPTILANGEYAVVINYRVGPTNYGYLMNLSNLKLTYFTYDSDYGTYLPLVKSDFCFSFRSNELLVYDITKEVVGGANPPISRTPTKGGSARNYINSAKMVTSSYETSSSKYLYYWYNLNGSVLEPETSVYTRNLALSGRSSTPNYESDYVRFHNLMFYSNLTNTKESSYYEVYGTGNYHLSSAFNSSLGDIFTSTYTPLPYGQGSTEKYIKPHDYIANNVKEQSKFIYAFINLTTGGKVISLKLYQERV